MRNWKIGAMIIVMFALAACEESSAVKHVSTQASNVVNPRISLERPPSIYPDIMVNSTVCPEWKNANISPSEFELPQFEHRLVNGRFQGAIAMWCVTYLYSPSQLIGWADKGDPVAVLANILIQEREVGFSCADRARIINNLESAAAVKVRDAKSGKQVVRVPEIFGVIDNIRFYCGDPLDQKYKQSALNSGFDEEALSPIKIS